MRIIFSGGGTGGHIYPALAIREILKSKFSFESGYVGIKGGMEDKIVSREKDIEFMGVRAQGMPRTISPKWFTFPFVNAMGIVDAWRHLQNFKPDIVVTTGGFVSFPVLTAAKLLGIPMIIHEQNAAMGVTNKLFANTASKVLLTYESAAKTDGEKVILTGNPVRKAFLQQEPNKEGSKFTKKDGEFIILSVGGSRGALSINKACIELANNWLPKHPEVRLIHISGERDYEMVTKAVTNQPANYTLLPYLHEMKEAFNVADLLISRAGATILSEIAVCQKPAILIPFPYATDNHQEKNARTLEKLGAAKVLLDKDLSENTLVSLIEELKAPEKLSQMAEAMKKSRPDDVEGRILEQISQLLK